MRMMNKLLTLLTSTKFVIALIILSAAIVIFGIVLIISAPTPDDTGLPETVQGAEPVAEPSFEDSLQTTESLIINSTQTTPNSSSNVTNLERGSEAWCEDMLVKANDQWNEADTQLFAQKCI